MMPQRVSAITTAAVLVAVAVSGCTGTGTAEPAGDTRADIGAARTALQGLRVQGRAPKTGYERGCKTGQGCVFGPAWSDDVPVAGGRNGCDTRNDILARDLREAVTKPGGCVVISGQLDDPYTGVTVAFRRGQGSGVQIDHVVALSAAWQTGAAALSPERRRALANDPANLQATTATANQSKGDSDAATWLPPNRAYRCTYAARQITVKTAYGLWVTPAEHDALARILGSC